MDDLDGSDVDTACWVGDQEKVRRSCGFAGHQDFLLVASREAAQDGRWIRRVDLKMRDLRLGVLLDGFMREPKTLVQKGGFVLSSKQQIFLDRVIHNDAVMLPIFGDISHACGQSLCCRQRMEGRMKRSCGRGGGSVGWAGRM